MDIDRLYFTFKQLAAHWEMSDDDLIQLGSVGDLEFHALVDWDYPGPGIIYVAQPVVLKPIEFDRVISSKESFPLVGEACESKDGILRGDKCIITYHPGTERLIVNADEVRRYEARSPDQVQKQDKPSNSKLTTADSSQQSSKPRDDKPQEYSKWQEHNKWLYDTWVNEKRLDGDDFFNKLKTYKGKDGSYILDYYTSPAHELLIKRKTIHQGKRVSRKTIQTLVSKFRKLENAVNS